MSEKENRNIILSDQYPVLLVSARLSKIYSNQRSYNTCVFGESV